MQDFTYQQWYFLAKRCTIWYKLNTDQAYQDFVLEAVIPVLNTSISMPVVWAKYIQHQFLVLIVWRELKYTEEQS